MATYRKRGKRWQVQVRKQGVAESASFDTKGAAQRWAGRKEHEIDEGKASGQGRATGTVADLIDRYEQAMSKRRPIGRTKASALKLLREGLGELPVKRLNADKLIAYAHARAEAGAGPVTLSIDLTYLGGILRAAYGLLGLKLSDAPVREAREALKHAGLVGKARSRERRPTKEEIARLCEHWRSNQRQTIPMADLLEFAIATAMRREEVCRIRWADLDEAHSTVIIRDRKDPRAKEGNDELIALLPVNGFDPLEIIKRQPRTGDRIFPYRPGSVSKAFERACDELGIKGLTLHDMRHEGVSRLFEAGLSIERVALISGHKDWRTLRRYTHLQARDLVTQYRPGRP